MNRCAVALALTLSLAGCKSGSWGPYTSPRVTGQVLAADTRKPLEGVSVSRGGTERQPKAPPKGGELMIRKVPVRTDEKGEFELQSERVLSIFRGSGWSQTRLHFTKSGYLSLQTNFSLSLGTNSATGEATLAIGQVLLQPAGKMSEEGRAARGE
jgi:hypothetical protein